MKQYRVNRFLLLAVVMLVTGLTLTSCEEDTDGTPRVEAGNPVAAQVMPDSAAGGSVVTLIGTGLGDMRSITFEKQAVEAGFQSTLNTAEALIFRVPTEAAGGVQNITFTNSAGKTTTIPFKVLAYPTVSDVSDYNFSEGTVITLTGNNLDDVTAVAVADSIKGISDNATIVSKEKKQLVVRMPASTLTRGTLSITNGTGTIRTRREFVNKDLSYKIFTDTFGAGFQNASWGDAAVVSTKEIKAGTASLAKTYQKGNWHLTGLSNWNTPLVYSAEYTYLTGWIKGASADYILYVTTDAGKGGFGNFSDSNQINVKADVWNYFKIKVSDMDFWLPGKKLTQVGFRIKGPDKQNETFYFDDILLVK